MTDKNDSDSNENLDSDIKKNKKTSASDKDAPAAFDTKTSAAFTEKGHLKSTSGLAAAADSKTVKSENKESDDKANITSTADEEDSYESLLSDDPLRPSVHAEGKDTKEIPVEEHTVFSGARGTPSTSTEKNAFSSPTSYIQVITGAAAFSIATKAEASGGVQINTVMSQDTHTFLDPKKNFSAVHQGDHVYTPEKTALSGGKSSLTSIEDDQVKKIENKQAPDEKIQHDKKPTSDKPDEQTLQTTKESSTAWQIQNTDNTQSTTHTSSSLGTESAILQSVTATPSTGTVPILLTPTNTQIENPTQIENIEEAENPPTLIEPIETGSTVPTTAANMAFGFEDTPISLNISGLFDSIPTGTLILVSNTPNGSVLSSGIQTTSNTYQLQASELPGLSIIPPVNSDENFVLEVSLQTTAVEIKTISVDVQAVADAPFLTANNVTGAPASSIPLDIASELTDTDGSEELFIEISGVPNDASLSAGTDLGGGVWFVPTNELYTLSYITSETSTDTTLTVTARSIEFGNEDIATSITSFDIDIFDQIFGTNMADNITGTSNADLIFGNEGDDFLEGGSGIDEVNGDDGNDTIFFGNGESTSNFIDGGSGSWIDTIDLKDATQGPTASLQGAGSWVLEVEAGTGFTVDEINKTVTFDTPDASGSIFLNDGSYTDFTNIEKIEW